MALLEEAKRVAAEFEFTAEDARRVYEEFIAQMGESVEGNPSLRLPPSLFTQYCGEKAGRTNTPSGNRYGGRVLTSLG